MSFFCRNKKKRAPSIIDSARSLFCDCDSGRPDQQPDQQPLRPSTPDTPIVLRPFRRQLAPEIGDQPFCVLRLRGDFSPQFVQSLPQEACRFAIRRPACHRVAHGLLAQQIPAGDALNVLRGTRRASAQEQRQADQQAGQRPFCVQPHGQSPPSGVSRPQWRPPGVPPWRRLS